MTRVPLLFPPSRASAGLPSLTTLAGWPVALQVEFRRRGGPTGPVRWVRVSSLGRCRVGITGFRAAASYLSSTGLPSVEVEEYGPDVTTWVSLPGLQEVWIQSAEGEDAADGVAALAPVLRVNAVTTLSTADGDTASVRAHGVDLALQRGEESLGSLAIRLTINASAGGFVPTVAAGVEGWRVRTRGRSWSRVASSSDSGDTSDAPIHFDLVRRPSLACLVHLSHHSPCRTAARVAPGSHLPPSGDPHSPAPHAGGHCGRCGGE